MFRLLQTLVLAAGIFSSNISPNISSPIALVGTKPDKIKTLQSKLECMDDVDVNNLSNDAIRALLKQSMTSLRATFILSPKRAKTIDPVTNLFGTPSQGITPSVFSVGTPKMDGLFASVSRGKGTTYNGVLKFLEDGNQLIFDSVSGFHQHLSRYLKRGSRKLLWWRQIPCMTNFLLLLRFVIF